MSATAGPAAAAAGKSIACANKDGSYTCVLFGLNQQTMPNGVAAVVRVTPATAGSASIGVANTLGASQDGTGLAIAGNGGTVSVTSGGPGIGLSGLSCSPLSLGSGQSSSCTVSLSGAAPSGGIVVSLASSNPLLSAPALVTVAGGSASAAFAVKAGTIPADQSATLTATLDGVSRTASFSLASDRPPVTLSSLQCTPASLTAGESSVCTVALSEPAPPAGITVVLAGGSAELALPAFVVVPAGSSTAQFTVTAGPVQSNHTVAVTATLNGTSQPALITLLPAPVQFSLSCNPTSLSSGQVSLCKITLAHAPAGLTVIELASSSTAVLIPPSAVIPGGQSSVNFTAAVGTVTSDVTATITASFAGVSQSVALTIAAPPEVPKISALQCTPQTLKTGEMASCTVTLTAPAPDGGLAVSLASSKEGFVMPETVEIQAGQLAGAFTVKICAVTSNETAVITASANESSQSAVLNLEAPSGDLVSVVCTPTTLSSGQVSFCTVTLARPAMEITPIALTSSTNALFVTPTAVVAPASNTVRFTALALQIEADDTATITAAMNGSSVKTSLTLNGPAQTIQTLSSLTCDSSTVVAGAGTQCTVELAGTAEEASVVRLASDNPRIRVPEAVEIAPGTASARFKLSSQPTGEDEESSIVAELGESSQTATVGLRGLQPAALACLPRVLGPGERATCELRLNASGVEEPVTLALSTSGSGLRLPASVTTRPGQATLTFAVEAGPDCGHETATVGARFGDHTAEDTITTLAAGAPVLTLPGDQLARFGARLAFTVAASDASGLPVELSADLPEGALFDPQSGSFTWTPVQSQQGRHEVVFTARNSAGAVSTGSVVVEVDDGKPVIESLLNGGSQSKEAVCSPGARATILGRWLFEGNQPALDPSGASTELGGTRVSINGRYAPVLYASPRRVDFLCPASDAGATLDIVVENQAGATEPAAAAMQDAAPGILSLDGSGRGQGLVFLSGTSSLAAARDYRELGQPAQPGDRVSLRATGLGGALAPASISVEVGGVPVPADSIAPVAGAAGIYEIMAAIPAGVEGAAVPVRLRVTAPGGRLVESNAVTIAVEGVRP